MLAYDRGVPEGLGRVDPTGAEFAINEIGSAACRSRCSGLRSRRCVSCGSWPRVLGDRDYLVFEDERYTYAESAPTCGPSPTTCATARGRSRRPGRGRDAQLPGVGRSATGRRLDRRRVRRHERLVDDPEMTYGLTDSAPKVLIADGERIERVLPVLDELRATAPLHLIAVRSDGELPADARAGPTWSTRRRARRPAGRRHRPRRRRQHLLHLRHAGFPKGAQLTHRGSVHNLMHIVFMTTAAGAGGGQGGRRRRPAALDADGDPRPDVFMAPTPLFHVTANNCLLHPATIRRSGSCSCTSGTPAGRSN